MKRALQVIPTGQWCGPLVEAGEFFDDGSAYADAVARTLGLEPGSLRVVDGDSDPRTGELVADPNDTPAPPPEPPVRPPRDVKLRTAIEGAASVAQLKAALLEWLDG